jgi:hypothetical protein
MVSETRQLHALLDENNGLVRNVVAPENLHIPGLASENQSVRENTAIREVLEHVNLLDLPALMDAETLDRFLLRAPLKDYINPRRDITQAAQQGRTVLLKHLLHHLPPSECPDTFDNSGYKTPWAQSMGGGLDQACSQAIASEDIETLEVLITHDTVLRTVFMNHDAYQVGVNPASPLSSLLKTGLRYSPASDETNLYRITSLQERLDVLPLAGFDTHAGLQQEVRALAHALTLDTQSPIQRQTQKRLSQAALSLGMEPEIHRQPLRFQDDQTATLDTLIEKTGAMERRYPRLPSQKEALATAIGNNVARHQLGIDLSQSQKLDAYRERQTAGNLQLPLANSAGNPITLAMGRNEWWYLNDEQFIRVVAQRISRSQHDQAKPIAKGLINKLLETPSQSQVKPSAKDVEVLLFADDEIGESPGNAHEPASGPSPT